MTKKLLFILIVLVSLVYSGVASASETGNTGFFAPLWDFLDWIAELISDIKNSILEFLIELILYFELLMLELKLKSITFIWSIVKPIINALNLTDVINSLASGLHPTVQNFMALFNIGEGLNMLISAKVTRMVMDYF